MNTTPDSWNAWLDATGAALLLVARTLCRNLADAEDAVQSGFLRFWKQRAAAHNPRAYLFRCVRAAALDQQRSQARRRRREARVAAGGRQEVWFRDELERDEQRAELAAALRKLPAAQAEVVALKIFAELSFAEIGALLTLSPNTVASRYRYALKNLAQVLVGRR